MKNKDLTSCNLFKGILIFSIPLIISNLLQQLFNVADTIVVGRGAGDIAIGAVGSTAIIITLFTAFALGIGNGVNALVGRYLGSKDDRDVHDTIQTAFIITIVMSVILLAASEALTVPLLNIVHTKELFMPDAIKYLRCYFIGLPGLCFFNFGNGIYSANGNTKTPLLFLSIAGVINIVLNIFFVFACNLSAMGVGIASAISQILSGLLIVVSLLREKSEIKLSIRGLRSNKDRLKELLPLIITSGIQWSIFAIANLFVTSAVNSLNEVEIEGNSASQAFDYLIYDVMAAFYVACSSFVSQNFGARKTKRIIQSYLISTLYSFGTGLLMGLILIAVGRPLMGFFTEGSDVVDAAMRRTLVLGLSYGISAFMDNTSYANRGLGHTVVPTIIIILGSCVFRIVWIYTVFQNYHTIESLYILYPISWTVTATIEIIYFVFTLKKESMKQKEIQSSC